VRAVAHHLIGTWHGASFDHAFGTAGVEFVLHRSLPLYDREKAGTG
jgi:hypothetical protein